MVLHQWVIGYLVKSSRTLISHTHTHTQIHDKYPTMITWNNLLCILLAHVIIILKSLPKFQDFIYLLLASTCMRTCASTHTHTHTHTHKCKNTFFLLHGFGGYTGGETAQWSTKAQEGCTYVCGRFIDHPQLGTGYFVHKKSCQRCDRTSYIVLSSDVLLFWMGNWG